MSRASCPQLWKVEAARVGKLGPAQAAQLRQHLQSGCSVCTPEQRYLNWLSATLLEREPACDEVALRRLRQATLNRARDALRRSSPAHPRDRRWMMIGAAVAVVAAAGVWQGIGRAPEIVVTSRTAGSVQRLCERDREVVVLGDGVYEVSIRRGLFDRHVVVQVPEGEIHDVGTVFGVSVEQGRTARVAVTQGAVDLHLRGVPEVRIHAGRVWEPAPHLELEEVPVAAIPAPPSVAPSTNAGPAHAPAHAPSQIAEHHRHARSHIRQQARAVESSHTSDADGAVIEPAGEDAMYLRVLDLLQQRRTADAKRVAELYLERFPTGFRSPEMARIARPDRPSE